MATTWLAARLYVPCFLFAVNSLIIPGSPPSLRGHDVQPSSLLVGSKKAKKANTVSRSWLSRTSDSFKDGGAVRRRLAMR